MIEDDIEVKWNGVPTHAMGRGHGATQDGVGGMLRTMVEHMLERRVTTGDVRIDGVKIDRPRMEGALQEEKVVMPLGMTPEQIRQFIVNVASNSDE